MMEILQEQLCVAQSRETAAEEAASEQKGLAELRERLASAEADKVGPLLAVDKGSTALHPEDLWSR